MNPLTHMPAVQCLSWQNPLQEAAIRQIAAIHALLIFFPQIYVEESIRRSDSKKETSDFSLFYNFKFILTC